MAASFKVAFVTAVAHILAGESIGTCGVDQECDDLADEASLLALHKQRITAMVTQGMEDQTPSAFAAVQFYLAVVRHQEPVYSAWTKAQQSVTFATGCCSKPPPGAPDTAETRQDKITLCTIAFQQSTCDQNKLHSALLALSDVPQKLNFNTTLDQVTAIAIKANASTISTYSHVYAMQTETGVQQLQLYVSKTSQVLTVNGQQITGFTFTPNCDQDYCLGLVNSLTWSEGNGNPSSGNLGFNYIMPYNKLPKNAYVGPYFAGTIGGKPVKGVVLQNNVVNCGTSTQGIIETNLTTFMAQGADIACFSGPYCVHLNGKFHKSLYNMTIQTTGVAVAGKMINGFALYNNRITWNLSGNDNAADLLFSRSGKIGNKFAGTIKLANKSTYNISGYIPSTNESCVDVPVLPAPVSNSVRVTQLIIKEFNSMVHMVMVMMMVKQGIELLPTILKGVGTVLSKIGSKISSIYQKFKAKEPEASDDLPKTLSENQANVDATESSDVSPPEYSAENLADANPNPESVQDLGKAEDQFTKLEPAQSEVDKTNSEIDDDNQQADQDEELAKDPDLPQSERDILEREGEAERSSASDLQSTLDQDQQVSKDISDGESSAAEEIKNLEEDDANEIEKDSKEVKEEAEDDSSGGDDDDDDDDEDSFTNDLERVADDGVV